MAGPVRNVLWLRARPRSRLAVQAILLLAAVWVLVPFLWAILNSIKTLNDTFRSGAIIPFLQFRPTLNSWTQALNDSGVLHALLSSVIVSGGATILVLAIGIPAAYSLARFEFPIASRDITLWFLSQRVLPPAVVLVPFYLMMVYFRLIDTWTGLIISYSTFSLAFGVVIMRDIFRDVSREVEEAAKVEGATAFQNLSADRAAAVDRRHRGNRDQRVRLRLERGAVFLGLHLTQRPELWRRSSWPRAEHATSTSIWRR